MIFGKDARESELRYMAQLRDKSDKFHRCGGTIISTIHILTSAHCFNREKTYWQDPEDYEIVLGSIKLDGGGGQIFGIDKIHIPAEYDVRTGESDIAVIKVN